MRPPLLPTNLFCLAFLLQGVCGYAQDDRRDYPSLLSRGYVELNVGHIDYPFSRAELEPGHEAESIDVPNLAVRLSLGYRFNDRISMQLRYLRPARWVQYRNIDGDQARHSVWMNVTGLTLTSRVPVKGPLSIYGEGGLGVVTRHGITLDRTGVVKDAMFATLLLGGGLEYRLSRDWGLAMSTNYSPSHSTPSQPSTAFYSGGITYRVDASSRRGADADSSYIFPKQLIQVGYTTSAFGDGFNTIVSPIFWEGDVGVATGVTLHYQRNVFHTRRVFSLDWGTSVAYMISKLNRNDFLSVSAYPLLRFTVLRTKAADLYVSYSMAGPTFISKFTIDGRETGRNLTLQDLFGVGVYANENRHINAEIRVGHYSNGNLLPRNTGIQVPLSFNLGYAFQEWPGKRHEQRVR